MTINNQQRTKWAKQAFDHYITNIEWPDQLTMNVRDLVADLGHMLVIDGNMTIEDALANMEMGLANFENEARQP